MMIYRSALLVLFALLTAACAGPVRPTGFLDDYSQLTAENDPPLLRVDAEQDDSLDRYFITENERERLEENKEPVPSLEADGISEEDVQPVLFVVEEPEWRAERRFEEAEEDEILFILRERMYRYLLRRYPHPVRVRYSWVSDDPLTKSYRTIRVRMAVTDVKTGNGTLRYLVGYGAGTTVLQLEGKLLEGGADPQPIGAFAIREDHGGYPQQFMNPRVFSAPYCLKYAAEQAVDRLATAIREEIPAARPTPGGTPPSSS